MQDHRDPRAAAASSTGGRALTFFLLIACGALAGLGLALLPALLSGATL